MSSFKAQILLGLMLISTFSVLSLATKASKASNLDRSTTDSATKASSSAETSSSSAILPTAGSAATTGIATMLSSFGSLTSLVPDMLSNAVPVVLMMGLGALLVPVFGLDSLLRVMKRRSLTSLPSIQNNFLSYINNVQDVLQKITIALEKMEKRYGN